MYVANENDKDPLYTLQMMSQLGKFLARVIIIISLLILCYTIILPCESRALLRNFIGGFNVRLNFAEKPVNLLVLFLPLIRETFAIFPTFCLSHVAASLHSASFPH